MIAFGICVSSEETYAAHAGRGIALAAGPHAVVIKRYGQTSLFEGYNSILEEAAELPDLEALVLLHDDLEIRDERFLDKLRRLFADDTIGLAGAIGARNVRSINWWTGERHGHVIWDGVAGEEGPRVEDFGAETTDVEAVDGLMMALSPWVVRNVRFDSDTFHGFSAADVDYCFTVRERGKRVVVSDFDLWHHSRPKPHRYGLRYEAANARWRAKWRLSRVSSPLGLRLQLVALRIRRGVVRIRRAIRPRQRLRDLRRTPR